MQVELLKREAPCVSLGRMSLGFNHLNIYNMEKISDKLKNFEHKTYSLKNNIKYALLIYYGLQ